MITLTLDWREVLWWMQGGMAGSHLRWSVYEDMVNKVWPQCSEQERRNLWYIMRRDLGSYWRPDGWSGYGEAHGEGEWKPLKGYTIDREDADGKPVAYIIDETPWMYFRQVLARFDPENQYAVTMAVHNAEELDGVLRLTPAATIISQPKIPRTAAKYDAWHSDTATVTVRAYKWQNELRIDWTRRCGPDRITKVEKIEIPDNGTM
jgi:hypothetical protein